MKIIEDFDVYGYRNGIPKCLSFLVLFYKIETWAIFVYRCRNYIYRRCRIPILRQLLILLGYLAGLAVRFLTTVSISEKATIGKGLFIAHLGNIMISHHTVIGDYCSIHQGVTCGGGGRGDNYGGPTIGNNVFIGANACIIGKITVGNHVIIGVNAVISENIADNSVMAAPRAKKISNKGSFGTIHYRDEKYEDIQI